MKEFNANLNIKGILANPQKDWNKIKRAAQGNVRTAFRKLDVDWKKYTTDNYLFTHDTIVCSVETEPNHYWIRKPCEELVNANGNAWSNEVLLGCFKTFVGGENFLEHVQQPSLSKGKILDAIIRPVVHHSEKYGDAHIYMCFDENTKIICNNGEWKNIGDLKENDLIYNGDGNLTSVVSIVKNKRKDLKQISIGGVADKIICTNDHPFLVFNPKEDKVEWVEAENLSENMWLMQPFINMENGTNHLDKNLAWLLGFYLAEGSLWKRNKNKEGFSCTQFTINSSELNTVLDKIEKVKEILGEYQETIVIKNRWGKEVSITRKHSGKCTYTRNTSGNGANISFYYPEFANLCFNLCGKGSSTKQINFDIFNTFDEETKLNFLAGYFDGDGNIRKQRLSVKSVSNKLIQQVSVILSSLKMPYKMNGSWWNKPYDKCMTIELTSHGLLKINPFMQIKKCELDNIKIRNGNRQVDICKNGILRKIYKIENLCEEKTVVDIKVEDGRSFLVSGIVAHNCDILVATNRKHADLVHRIESGKLSTLSMGCLADKVQCSICGKIIGDGERECEHLERHLGKQVVCEDGETRICAELCGCLGKDGNFEKGSCEFIEASWVDNPAFPGAVLNEFVETPEIKQARESEERDLAHLFDGNLFERLKVADKESNIAIKVVKKFSKIDKIAQKVARTR